LNEIKEVQTLLKELEETKIYKYVLVGSVNNMRLPHPREGPGTAVTVGLSQAQTERVGSIHVKYKPGLELGKRFDITLRMVPLSEENFLSKRGIKAAPPPIKELAV